MANESEASTFENVDESSSVIDAFITATQLIKEGAIVPLDHPDDNEVCRFNLRAARKVLVNRPEIKLPNYMPERYRPLAEEVAAISKAGMEALTLTLRRRIESGPLTPRLLDQLKMIIGPRGVRWDFQTSYTGDIARFAYFYPRNSRSRKTRGKILLGDLPQYEKDIIRLARQADVALDADKARKIVIKSAVAHEMGHAISAVLAILDGDPDRFYLPPQALDIIAPHPLIPSARVFDNAHTHTITEERFAEGFSQIELRQAALEAGLLDSEVERILLLTAERNQRYVNAYGELLQALGNPPMIWANELEIALSGLFNAIENNEIKRRIPLDFSPMNLGYLLPLNLDQLKQFLNPYG